MKWKTWSRLGSVLLLAVACGCGGSDTVTGPPLQATAPPLPTPTAAPPAVDLNGPWQGTIGIRAPKFTGLAQCQASPIAGTLSQAGNRVSGQLQSTCAGRVRLDATLSGNRLDGTLASDLAWSASFSGTANAARVSVSTVSSDEEPNVVSLSLSH